MRTYKMKLNQSYEPKCDHNTESWKNILLLFSNYARFPRTMPEECLIRACIDHVPPPSRRMETKQDNAIAFINYLTREIGILELVITR